MRLTGNGFPRYVLAGTSNTSKSVIRTVDGVFEPAVKQKDMPSVLDTNTAHAGITCAHLTANQATTDYVYAVYIMSAGST